MTTAVRLVSSVNPLPSMLLFCLLVGVVGFATALPAVRDVPVISSSYVASGILHLPYAEIDEPFDAWFDGPGLRSRVDYYNGMVKTYQRGDVSAIGVSYEIAPMTNEEVTNVATCFAVNGSSDYPVTVQSVFPDLTGFNYSNDEACGDSICAKWVQLTLEGNKYNKNTFLITTSPVAGTPFSYEMQGYDSLLGSHYDKYEIEYTKYDAVAPDPSVFDVPQNVTCGSFPGPGMQHVHLHNPVKEYVDHHDDHVHILFEEFKEKHGKTYADDKEHGMRKNVFRQNLRYIHSTNRKGLMYQLATNHLADYTDRELRMMRGRVPSEGYNGGLPFQKDVYVAAAPDEINWRLYGAVTPVKDQAVCGSCWSFGTVGTLEGSYFLKTGQLLKFSEQALVDCTWGYGDNGCDGGEDFRAYQWIMKHGGIPLDDSYGPYLGADGYCHADNATKLAAIDSYVNITEGDIDGLKLAIANQGPICVSIDASLKDFSFYSNGVYYNAECKNGYDELDHSVLAVGYGVQDGEPYWLIKNSWSTYWGNDGYVLMSQTDNNCGVATAATYANLSP